MEIVAGSLALIVPAVVAFVAPAAMGEARVLLWFLALLPVVLLARRDGWEGGALATGVSLVAMAAAEGGAAVAGRTDPPIELVVGVALALGAISIGISWLAGSLLEDYREAERRALTDPLTGLPNRRRAQIFLDTEFSAAERGRELAVVLFDLDHFKRYNDEHGHGAGDDVLEALGHVLTSHTRRMNLSARYGGEEFLTVLSDCDIEGAVAFAERVRNALAAVEIPGGPVTASAGVATYDAGMQFPEDLVAAADRALYAAKRQGRNRVETEPPGEG